MKENLIQLLCSQDFEQVNQGVDLFLQLYPSFSDWAYGHWTATDTGEVQFFGEMEAWVHKCYIALSLMAEFSSTESFPKLICIQEKLACLPAELEKLVCQMEIVSGEVVWVYDIRCRGWDVQIQDLRLECIGRFIEENPDRAKQILSLNLTRQGLKKIPSWVQRLTNLNCLRLQQNHLTNLPSWLFDLVQLREINLAGNRDLRSLPADIERLQNLQVLLLNQTRVRELPREIVGLINLTHLNLSSTGTKALPKELAQLENLRHVSLNNCFGLDPSTIPSCWYEMENFSATGVGWFELPLSICQWKKLKKLNLARNHISAVPVQLCQIQTLELLDLRVNRCVELPREIFRLPNLRTLIVAGNPLKTKQKQVIDERFPGQI